jgi:hypothetical protein
MGVETPDDADRCYSCGVIEEVPIPSGRGRKAPQPSGSKTDRKNPRHADWGPPMLMCPVYNMLIQIFSCLQYVNSKILANMLERMRLSRGV